MAELGFSSNPYMNVTIDQYTTHTSGMPASPSREANYEWENTSPDRWNPAGAIALKLAYVKNALLDPEQCPPGTCFIYGGGQIINAAMLEHITNTCWEQLMQQYVFEPLGMVNSRFGRTAVSGDDGPYQHAWSADTMTLEPQTQYLNPGYDWSPRNPVGGVGLNAADLGSFLVEMLTPTPKTCTVATRESMQTFLPASPVSSYTRGAWAFNAGPPTSIWYWGDDGSQLAYAEVRVESAVAWGGMCNADGTFGWAATNDVVSALQTMYANWNSMFSSSDAAAVECAHQMPALIFGGGTQTVCARRHTGAVTYRSAASGDGAWTAPQICPGWVMTSGLAAACSDDGKVAYLLGRGADNQIWFGKSTEGATWRGAYPVPAGIYITGPAVGVSADGMTVHIVAIGMDRRMFHTLSTDGGAHWTTEGPIGAGLFTSAPAITVSADGSQLTVFGRGDDYRIWTNHFDGSWQSAWQPIGHGPFTSGQGADTTGQGLFTSGPGAAASADGSTVHVMARGTDTAMSLWHNQGSGQPGDWQSEWTNVPDSTCVSAPSLCRGASPADLYVATIGDDFTLHVSHSGDAGSTWDGPYQVGPDTDFFL